MVRHIALIAGGSSMAPNTPSSAFIFDVLLKMITSPIGLALLIVAFMAVRGLFFTSRGIWHSIHNAARLFMLKGSLRGWPVSRILFRAFPPLDDHSSGPSVTTGI